MPSDLFLTVDVNVCTHDNLATLEVSSLTQIRSAQARSLSLAELSACRWAGQNLSVLLHIYFLMPDGRPKRKSRSENRNATWKTYMPN